MARRNVDVFAGIGSDHIALDFFQAIEDLRDIDDHGEDRAEQQIIDEVRSPLDFPIQQLENEELQTIELAFDGINSVECQQASQVVNNR